MREEDEFIFENVPGMIDTEEEEEWDDEWDDIEYDWDDDIDPKEYE